MKENRDLYNKHFFEGQVQGSSQSAHILVPKIIEVLQPRNIQSVIDVGCGTGAWLERFAACGVSYIQGIDGEYVNPAVLRIESSRFSAQDLTRAIKTDRHFDLALCLEVGEHLPEASSETLVRSLCEAADVVVFSACPPTPRHGTGHINERRQSFWACHFRAMGLLPSIALRSKVWSDSRIEWFYRQNMVIYARKAVLDECKLLVADESDLDVYHPDFVAILIKDSLSTHTWKDLGLVLIKRAVRRLRAFLGL